MTVLAGPEGAALTAPTREGLLAEPGEGPKPRAARKTRRAIATQGPGEQSGGLPSESAATATGPSAAKEVAPPTLRGAKQVAPIKRGGRPRGRDTSEGGEGPTVAPSAGAKPEVVCLEKERRWVIAVEVPENLASTSLSVLQNETRLTDEPTFRHCYELLSPITGVSVYCGEQLVAHLDPDQGQGFLLFRLVGHRGRQVRQATIGNYLAVVPESWVWDAEVSGGPPVAPEQTSLSGYQAYFFDASGAGTPAIAFRANGEQIRIPCRRRLIRLAGNALPDSAEGVGPLFGDSPPTIKLEGAAQAGEIRTLVFGEEGPGRDKWRAQVLVSPGDVEVPPPEELMTRAGGWYFLRVYDANGELVESLDFRFMSALKEIRASPHPALPGTGGHVPVHVQFMHDHGCSVAFADGGDGRVVVTGEPGCTKITLPPDPAWDRISCTVSEDGVSVDVVVATRRVWWAIGEEDETPDKWVDAPMEVSRRHFAPTSTTALWVRFSVLHLAEKLYIGFNPSTARPYRLPAQSRQIPIPLRELGDMAEIEDLAGEPDLLAWLDTPKPGSGSAVLLVRRRLRCKLAGCGFRTPGEEEMVSHIRSDHLVSLSRRITDYEELRTALPEPQKLPRFIHRCCKCDVCFTSDDNRPDEILYGHDCSKVNAQFEVIRDVDKIRRLVIRDLPEAHRCTRGCVVVIPRNQTADAVILGHLFAHHRDDLFEQE